MTGAAFGIDIGGSSIKLGLVSAAGAVIGRRTISVAGLADFADLCAQVMRALADLGDVRSHPVGVASPGYADPATGRIVDGAGNIRLLRGESLSAVLTAHGAPRVIHVNDGVAAALGEYRFGSGRGCPRFALVTIGTGIGGAVVIDGRPVTGTHGEPPEIGAIVLGREGGHAPAGHPAGFEDLAAAPAFARSYARLSGKQASGPEDVFARAAAGDPDAIAAVDAIAAHIAQALGTMTNLLALQVCAIGGGVATAGAPLLDRVRAWMPAFTWPLLLRQFRLCLASTGNDAGLVGAADLALTGGPPMPGGGVPALPGPSAR